MDSLNVSSFPLGLNILSIRFLDDKGIWSPPKRHFFVIQDGKRVLLLKHITYAEYWFNEDQFNRKGIQVPRQGSFSLMDSVDISALKGNPNVIHYRFPDDQGIWSSTESKMFIIADPNSSLNAEDLVSYRYWISGFEDKMREVALSSPLPAVYIIDSADLRRINSGRYILNVQVKDRSGKWSSTISDTILRTFKPYISFNTADTLTCAGALVTFSFDTADVDLLIWNYGTGLFDTTYFPGVRYTSPGKYTVSVTAVNVDSNIVLNANKTIDINVFPSYDSTSVNTICEGDSMLFNGNWHFKDSVYLYAYTSFTGCDSVLRLDLTVLQPVRDSVSRSICQGQSFAFGSQILTGAGNYTEKFTATSGCDSIVQLDLSVTGVDTSVSPSRTSLSANALSASFQWLDCNLGYQAISGAASSNFSPSQNGSYAVEVTQNGCTDTSACYAITAIGLQENLFRQHVKIFPNPAGDFVFLEFTQEDQWRMSTISIFDSRGRIIKSFRPTDRRSGIELTGLESGVYIIHVQHPEFNGISQLVKH